MSEICVTSVSYIWVEIVKILVSKSLQFKTISITLLIDTWNGKWDLRIIWSQCFFFNFLQKGKKTQNWENGYSNVA